MVRNLECLWRFAIDKLGRRKIDFLQFIPDAKLSQLKTTCFNSIRNIANQGSEINHLEAFLDVKVSGDLGFLSPRAIINFTVYWYNEAEYRESKVLYAESVSHTLHNIGMVPVVCGRMILQLD